VRPHGCAACGERAKDEDSILSGFVEVEFGTYASGRDATLAQWRAQKRLAKDGGRADDDRRIINHLVKLGDKLGIPEDVPLIPRLRELGQLD